MRNLFLTPELKVSSSTNGSFSFILPFGYPLYLMFVIFFRYFFIVNVIELLYREGGN